MYFIMLFPYINLYEFQKQKTTFLQLKSIDFLSPDTNPFPIQTIKGRLINNTMPKNFFEMRKPTAAKEKKKYIS